MLRLKSFFLEKIHSTKWRLIFLVLAFFLLYILHGIYVWINSESTDNAYLQSNITFVSPEVSGVVEQILFVENQYVTKGDLLLKIKDTSYKAQYNKAKIALSQADLAMHIAEASLKIALINSRKAEEAIELAKLNLVTAQREFARVSKLTSNNFSSKKLLDDANLALQKAQTEFNQCELSLLSAKENILMLESENKAAMEKAMAAKEDLIIAEYNYKNTEIHAPIDGIITSNSSRIGGYARASSPIFAIVPKSYYLKANFKETQISKMKPGMKATVEFDSIGGAKFKGKIRNIYPATGANFSLIPTDSATGNFTKIVQRIPVIIDIDIPEKYQNKFASGISAYVHIRTDQ